MPEIAGPKPRARLFPRENTFTGMTFTKEQQKIALVVSLAVLILLNVYRFMTAEKPRTAPLVYKPGAVATSAVRPGAQTGAGSGDSVSMLLDRSRQRYPGMVRDLFRMQSAVVKPVSRPTPTVVVMAPPPTTTGPERSPEDIAADLARADISKFRYLGYTLTDKDNSFFLSKDGELFIVKSSDRTVKNYTIKEANKDYIVLLDPATRVEGKIELSGSGEAPRQPAAQPQQAPQLPARPGMAMPPQPPMNPSAGQTMQQPMQPNAPSAQRQQIMTSPSSSQPARPLMQRRIRNLRPGEE